MNTANNSNNRNSNPKIVSDFVPITLAGLTFVVLFGITSCFDSSTEDNNNDLEPTKTSIEKPTTDNHTDNVGGFDHAPGKETRGLLVKRIPTWQ